MRATLSPITLISGDPLISDDHLSHGNLLSGTVDHLFVLPSQPEQ
ncbi:hypothetical protein A2U01_0100416 [Trifolium medium]|uniref:Uncharacterized protein n=1 Tax=Trifolium medium TaxID=97028 RepID=A0A392UWR6_9FABA|nr:hypothetical protein [Trifolium medium]